MATIAPTWTVAALPNNSEAYGSGASARPIECPWLCISVKWNNVSSGTSDVCVAAPTGYLVDKSVQISGGTVTDVAIQGSNDNEEYYVLNDPQGNALSGVNAEKLEQVLENTLYIKPVVTTGTNVDIVVFGRIPVV